jgi:hypothetical protein
LLAEGGAEKIRAAKIDGKGNPVDYAINERCAAVAMAWEDNQHAALFEYKEDKM